MSRRTLIVVAAVALLGGGCSTPAGPPYATTPLARGTYTVGVDIGPGRYTTKNPHADDNGNPRDCFWTRYKSTQVGQRYQEQMDALIDIGVVEPGDEGSMVVKKTDGSVQFTGDCTWKQEAR